MSDRITSLTMVVAVMLAGCSTSTATSAPTPVPTAAATQIATKTPVATKAVGAPCEPKAVAFDAGKLDLTGAWAGDDRGIYYLRQVGKILWWNGMADRAADPAVLGRTWNNVGRGEIKGDLTIAVEWADVPRGQILGYGTLNLQIGKDANGSIKITKVSETGTGFGNGVWTPCSPG
jgi:hypothetical protein